MPQRVTAHPFQLFELFDAWKIGVFRVSLFSFSSIFLFLLLLLFLMDELFTIRPSTSSWKRRHEFFINFHGQYRPIWTRSLLPISLTDGQSNEVSLIRFESIMTESGEEPTQILLPLLALSPDWIDYAQYDVAKCCQNGSDGTESSVSELEYPRVI